MAPAPENWKTQIRKGYLELCLLRLIDREERIYGFDLIEKLSAASLEVKEGTLYPLLNRLNADGLGILLTEQNVAQSLAIAHRGYVLETGSVTRNRVPAPGVLLRSIRPSCASTMARTIDSPSPAPGTWFAIASGAR